MRTWSNLGSFLYFILRHLSPTKDMVINSTIFLYLNGGGRPMRKMKKGMAILLAMVLTIAGLYSGSQVVRAENGGTETYNIDFSYGTINANVISYTIGESVVTATLPDTINLSNKVASLSPNDEITLSDNYNADTMQVRVYASDGFDTTLAVENGKTKLANKQNQGGLPTDLKLVIEAKNNAGGGSGNEPGENESVEFSGTVYFVWQGAEDRLCIHRFDNLTPGWTDDTTNYFHLSDVKDDSTNEAFTMSAANSVYWMWDNATEFLTNYQTYSSMKEALEADENTKRSYAIDPCGFENSANCVGTYGDRQFRAVIIDNTKYESISFSADANDYEYFPKWWAENLFTSTVDISNTTKENPAIYESFIEEPNIKFSTGANSTSAITSVTALDVPSSAVSVSGGQVCGEYMVVLPGSYILSYGGFPKLVVNVENFFANRKINKIVKDVLHSRSPIMKKTGLFYKESEEPRLLKAIEAYGIIGSNYSVSEGCVGCGTCVKVCPVNNISIVDGKPIFEQNCQQCMACIQWCPTRAIDYEKKASKRRRYHHPQITVKDMMLGGKD